MNLKKVVVFTAVVFMLAGAAFSSQVMIDGAKTGVWTMDYDAALKLAKTKNLPIFINFTGSDWCVWCKLMQERVFSQKEWKDYAKEHLVLITLDFPQDQTIVPEKYKARNRALQAKMGVGGYPTFILLDSDGKTKLAQLGAGQDKTAQSFIEEVKQALKTSAAEINKFAKTLSKKSAKNYKKYWAELKKTQAEMNTWLAGNPAQTEENLKKFDNYNKKIAEYQQKIRTIEIAKYAEKLSKADAAQYRELNKKLDRLQQELEAWLQTRPERTQENTNKFMTYQSEIQDVSAKIRGYEE
jgi:thioredoxin-related protein